MAGHRLRESGTATLAGLGAILLWAALALFTVAARGLPPFELLGLSFGTACLSGTAAIAVAAALVVGGAVLATGVPLGGSLKGALRRSRR